MENKTKIKLQNGGKAVGTFFELGGNSAVECLGIAGLDFLIIDSEHGPFDVESAMEFVRTAKLRGITSFVRVKEISRSSILKMLDIGAEALVIPCVETIDEVKKIVEYGKYFPVGKRGFFYGRGAGYGYESFVGSIEEYFQFCNTNTMLIPQCETKGCLENIEEIAKINGVDGIFVGPYDLSIGLGKPGDFENPEFKEGIERILKACKEAKKFAFIYTGNAETGSNYLSEGFDGVAVSFDAAVYIEAYKDILKKIDLK